MFTQRALKQMAASGITQVPIERDDLLDKAFAISVSDPQTGAMIAQAGDVIDETLLKQLEDAHIHEFETVGYHNKHGLPIVACTIHQMFQFTGRTAAQLRMALTTKSVDVVCHRKD